MTDGFDLLGHGLHHKTKSALGLHGVAAVQTRALLAGPEATRKPGGHARVDTSGRQQ